MAATRFPTDKSDPTAAFYEVIELEAGTWVWRWHEPEAEATVEDECAAPFATRADALRDAADNAEDTFGDMRLGAALARRLRTAARAADRAAGNRS